MRFQQYLTEDKAVDAIQPFLKEFEPAYQAERFIWRGFKNVTDKFTVVSAKKDREPRLVPQELHEFLGEISKKYFGWNARAEGVFTADERTVKRYGREYIFAPMGQYKYVWTLKKNEIYSLYDRYSGKFRDAPEEEVQKLKDELELYYKNHYLKGGLSSYLKGTSENQQDFEAIFSCDKYLLIDPDFWEENFKRRIFG